MRAGTVMAAACALALAIGAAPASAATERWGYITMRDGVQLRYTVDLPADHGRFPVAMDYDGYCEGTGPLTCNDTPLANDLLDAGYAVLGVSVRGTGCSTGTFDFRAPEESSDGATAVTWAAKQPWSTGRVGMFGDSFPGLTQPGVAALRPKGLAAIAPWQIVDDVYRDVGYPGGISNTEFGAFWALGDQPAADTENPERAAQQGDAKCAANWAAAHSTNGPNNIALVGLQHPWFDDLWASKEVGPKARRIAVPVFGCASWQDDEVGSRPAWSLFPRLGPSRLWFVGANGYHAMCELDNDLLDRMAVRFFDRFVRGTRNGFEATPHFQIWHEAHQATQNGTTENVPSWVSSFRSWPPPTRPTPLYLRAGGRLDGAPATTAEPADTYVSPQASAGTEEGVVFGQSHVLWDKPVPPGGAVAWTTPPLHDDVEALGPASADVWLSSTAPDTDLQVTITEVRPDGQETYVARGWLRASHRKLDRRRSTATAPYQTHRLADAEPLTPGRPTLVRIEVFPFDHVFRAGSSMRMIVDTPSQTGGWNFGIHPTPEINPVTEQPQPAVNSVLHDPDHPSRLVYSLLPGGRAEKPLPACNTLLNQPCRTSAYPVPR